VPRGGLVGLIGTLDPPYTPHPSGRFRDKDFEMQSGDSFTPRSNGASDAPLNLSASPPPGLPAVSPPSGKLMLQLFLVPGLIVAFLVVAWLVGGWLFGVSYSKEQFLTRLKDPNVEVRWRAAEQLAQVLLRDDALASDGEFARQLALMLEKTRDEAAPAELAYASKLRSMSKDDTAAARRKLEPDRTFIAFLCASLGDFMVPVGAPMLKELASQKEGIDPKIRELRRRQAVWALANLGQNLKRFDKLDGPKKEAVLEKLNADSDADHADWMRDASRALSDRTKGVGDDMGVGDVLIACSRDKDDPYLRELSAFAMNFWRGDAAANARMEEALTRLTHDDGVGEDNLAELSEDQEESPTANALSALTGGGNSTVAMSKIPGLQIRFNAAVALARMGSKAAPLDLLQDMLNEGYLRTNLILRPRKGGDDRPNEEVIGQTLLNTLKAAAELHRLRPDMDLSSLAPAVDALAGSGNPDVRTEAETTKLALK
jgi:hypothetical protein